MFIWRSIFYVDSGLSFLSIINIALLSSRFLIKHKQEQTNEKLFIMLTAAVSLVAMGAIRKNCQKARS